MAYEVEQLVNNVSTTLNGGINNSVTTVVITSATGFPPRGVFRVIVGSEIMKVTARSGTSLTVVRGSEGTTAVTHADTTVITVIQTAAAVQALLVDALGRPLYTHPNLADFAWVNQGSATVSDSDRGLYLEAPVSGSDSVRILKQTAPSTPYTLTAKLVPTFRAVGTVFIAGIGFREAGTGKLLTLGFTETGATDGYLTVDKWTSPTAYVSTPAFIQSAYKAWIAEPWFRLRHDGTTLYLEWSNDGYTFITLRSEAKTVSFTTDPDEVLFFVTVTNATYPAGVRLLSWSF